MPIPVFTLWKPSLQDLHDIAANAMAARAILAMPLLRRRARMVEFEYPRLLYKFREIPRSETKADRNRRVQLEGMLLNNELFAATSEGFNDTFDAQADYRVEERDEDLRSLVCNYMISMGADDALARAIASDELLAHVDDVVAMMKSNHQALLRQLGVCCLSATARDPLLWAHYAQSHRGIAVQYCPSLDPVNLQPHQVKYDENYPVIDNFFDRKGRDIFQPLLRKSPSWKYEEEWRVLRPNRPNLVFQVSPEAITGIILGMRISDVDRGYIRALADERDKHYGIQTRIFQAEASPGKYKVRMRRLK